jgi:hypothetical protein
VAKKSIPLRGGRAMMKTQIETSTIITGAVYKKAYSQIIRKNVQKNENDDENKLSIDIVAVDSVGWAQFQRDAVLSWPYMRDVMGMCSTSRF